MMSSGGEGKSFFNLTGNPFVDAGIGVISSLAKVADVNQLTLSQVKDVYGDGSQLTDWNSKLKAFTQIFGTNNPLFNPSYGFKKGVGPSNTNKAIYKSTLNGLLSEINKPRNGLRCWACGESSSLDFANVCKKAVEDNGKKAPDDKWIGRDWFPLAGSLGSDAQALPAASMPPHICAKCLFALHYLPLGLILLNGRLVVFQCTSNEFWYELIHDITNEVKGRIQAGNYETLGRKEGSRAVLRRILGLFDRLKREKHCGGIPEGVALYVWRFSNSGASPECFIEEIPNPAIIFLWEVVQMGLRQDIEALILSEGKNPRYSLFQCVLDKRDYPNLYAKGRRKGTSLKFFILYQTRIRGHSIKALQTAYKLAKMRADGISEKELKRIQRPEAFKDERFKNQFRTAMVQLTQKGEFSVKDYLDIFPLKEGNGITVEWDGWNLIRFCLHHTTEDFPEIDDKGKSRGINEWYLQLVYYAGKIYNYYHREKGRNRFEKEVLAQMGRRRSLPWLRSQFLQLAELEEGFTYGQWLRICKLDDGQLFASEMVFQMRLLWTQWIRKNRTSVKIPAIVYDELSDGFPQRIKALLEAIFTNYTDRRELGRFHRDILLRLRRKKVGLSWLEEKLTKKTSEDNIQPLTKEEWDEFLVDDNGQSIRAERLFQIHLMFANLYRLKRFKENTKEVAK
jgi:hypothetical protein